MKVVLFFVTILVNGLITVSGSGAYPEEEMFFKNKVNGNFDNVTERVKESLKEQGFGIITEIDLDQKLNEKLDTQVQPYRILGACNPAFAYETLQIDDNIGVFLPCKIIIKQLSDHEIEVVSVNPARLIRVMQNAELDRIAVEVSEKLKSAIENL